MLVARFEFPDWLTTLAFVNALGWIAHDQDHHPDLLITYSRCEVRWATHSAGGITLNDFICAARVEALVPTQQQAPAQTDHRLGPRPSA